MTYATQGISWGIPGWEALGWTLIHFCWQAAAIALLYRVADLALGKARSNVRYVAALAALLSMLAAAVVTLGYEEMRGQQGQVALRDSAVTSLGETTAAQALPRVDYGTGTVWPGEGTGLLAAAKQGIRPAMPWLDAMWLLGVLFLSARTVGGWWVIQRLQRASLMRVPPDVQYSFARLSLRLGIWWSVDLRISERIASPLAMGVMRSLVLIPASALTSLSPEQLEVVLAHELAHIRRADYLWNMVQTMIETLFFFHPAVWWVSGHLRQQRELCCDDVALECCTDPLIYATALLCLEEHRGMRPHLAMALDGHQRRGLRSGLGARIGRMLGETPRDGREIAPWSLLGVCTMLGLLLLPAHQVFAGLYPIDASTKQQATSPMMASTVVAEPHSSKIAGDPNADAPAPAPAPATGSKPPAAVASRRNMPASRVAAVLPPAPRPQPAPAPEVAPIAPEAEISALPMTLIVASSALRAKAYAYASYAQASSEASAAKGDYIDQMRAAGYNVDVDKYVAMKIQGVTPQYAQRMATTGFGKPTADDLIAMKIHGVDPSEVAELKAAGIEPGSYQDLITYRIFKVSPEFVAGMKAAGYSPIPAKKLVELRIHGVTPEFAKATKQQFPTATVDQLVELRIFNINEAFMASAKRHGLEPLTIEKLVKIRISGVLDDEDQKSEKTQ
jgi:beta-lactamase regulating signal transducer with metallopeptidase domain